MNYILCDIKRANLFPFTLMRPVADVRTGILTIREKWEKYLEEKTSTCTDDYLSEKYPLKTEAQNICINASVLPTENLVTKIKSLKQSQQIIYKGKIVAVCLVEDEIKFNSLPESFEGFETINYTEELLMIENIWDIFLLNDKTIRADFNLLTHTRKSEKISSSNKVIGEEIFIESGAKIECSIINASTGPVYIGKHAEVMEGSIIRGPLALCEHSTLKMGAKIYGATTVGPHSKVGGEVSNSVIFGYSNKAHDGFLGNSVIGEWCNLGADTNNSNLKNNYSHVKVWSFSEKKFIDTGLQFCGLFLGDHSKTGINSMFNTGTVTGVCCNIFGGDFPPKDIPSFFWGGSNGFEMFKLNKAIELATEVYKRRNMVFEEKEVALMKYLYEELGK
jgi:UDP-N-acetylglucosamine diphosphorylase/glucosamine-1-phosphate N-acetyltransferase